LADKEAAADSVDHSCSSGDCECFQLPERKVRSHTQK